MAVYIGMLIVILFSSFIDSKNIKKNNLILGLLPFACLFIVSAIRYNVGIDYSGTYTNIYYSVLNGFTNIRVDFGFLLIYRIIVSLNMNLQWFFVITSFLINLFIYKSIKKLSNNKTLSYYIYVCSTFYFFSMNGIRQALAMSLFYYSIIYIKENKKWKYLLLNLIGVFFHQSALIFLPIYFFVNYRFKNKKLYLYIFIITFISSSILLPIISNLLINTKYRLYFMHNNYSPLNSINLSSVLNMIMLIIYIYNSKNHENDKEYDSYLICHFIGAELSIFLTSIPLTLRIFESFRFIDFLSVPYFIEKHFLKNRSIVKIFIYSFYFMYFIYHIWMNNANGVLPYRTFFD